MGRLDSSGESVEYFGDKEELILTEKFENWERDSFIATRFIILTERFVTRLEIFMHLRENSGDVRERICEST